MSLIPSNCASRLLENYLSCHLQFESFRLWHALGAISPVKCADIDTSVYPQVQSAAKEAPKAVDKVRTSPRNCTVSVFLKPCHMAPATMGHAPHR